jgi:hypothetical protein
MHLPLSLQDDNEQAMNEMREGSRASDDFWPPKYIIWASQLIIVARADHFAGKSMTAL